MWFGWNIATNQELIWVYANKRFLSPYIICLSEGGGGACLEAFVYIYFIYVLMLANHLQ